MVWLCIFRIQWWIGSLLLSLLTHLSLEAQGSESTSKNVALNKTARQSSFYENKGDAEHAVDGDTSQTYNDGSCTHTNDEYNPYWEVDLGDIYIIDEIIIYPRWDCCRERTSDVLIELSIDSAKYITACFKSGMLPSRYRCEPQSFKLGRWVKVSLTGSTKKPLHICEVQVMSTQAVNRGEFKHLEYVKGSGSVIKKVSARSQIECVCICGSNKKCISANVIQDSGSSTGIMCELLQSNVTSEAPDGIVSFWTLGDLV